MAQDWSRYEGALAEQGFGVDSWTPPGYQHPRSDMCRAVDCEGHPLLIRILPHTSEKAQRCLRARIRALQRVSHRALAPIREVITLPDGVLAVAIELIEGVDLAVRQAALPVMTRGEAVTLIRDIGEGLAALHAHGLIHGDISPANIVITSQGHAVLVDLLGGEDEYGTVPYAAPECQGGDTGKAAQETVSGRKASAGEEIWATDAPLEDTRGEAADVYAFVSTLLWCAKNSPALRDALKRWREQAGGDALSDDPQRRPTVADLVRVATACGSPVPIEMPTPCQLAVAQLQEQRCIPTRRSPTTSGSRRRRQSHAGMQCGQRASTRRGLWTQTRRRSRPHAQSRSVSLRHRAVTRGCPFHRADTGPALSLRLSSHFRRGEQAGRHIWSRADRRGRRKGGRSERGAESGRIAIHGRRVRRVRHTRHSRRGKGLGLHVWWWRMLGAVSVVLAPVCVLLVVATLMPTTDDDRRVISRPSTLAAASAPESASGSADARTDSPLASSSAHAPPTDHSVPSTAASSASAGTPAIVTDDDLRRALVALLAQRDRALETRDRRALESLSVPGSPAAAADAQILDGLEHSGTQIVGLATTATTVERASLPPEAADRWPGAMAVRLTQTQQAYTRITVEGQTRVPVQPPRDIIVVLVPQPWRVADVVQAPPR